MIRIILILFVTLVFQSCTSNNSLNCKEAKLEFHKGMTQQTDSTYLSFGYGYDKTKVVISIDGDIVFDDQLTMGNQSWVYFNKVPRLKSGENVIFFIDDNCYTIESLTGYHCQISYYNDSLFILSYNEKDLKGAVYH